MTIYCISSVHGIARAQIVKKPSGDWTLHVELTPRGACKIAGYLTQSGHTTRRQAKQALYGMQDKIESELIRLG